MRSKARDEPEFGEDLSHLVRLAIDNGVPVSAIQRSLEAHNRDLNKNPGLFKE